MFTPEITRALAAPFPDDEVRFLPRDPSGGEAMALAYVDARTVMQRLDQAVGQANWSFDWDPVSSDGRMVRGRLTVYGVCKSDAGEAAREGEVLKSAVSDALKRCAVHFGVGRYLYALPRQWAPYDSQKKRWTRPPRLDPAAVRAALARCGYGDGQASGVKRQASGVAPGAVGQAIESGGDRAVVQAAAPWEQTCSGEGCGRTLSPREREFCRGRAPQCYACQKREALKPVAP